MATHQEVVAAVTEARGRIKSGVLADVPSNGHALTSYLMKHKLEPTTDNFHRAIVDLAGSLIWTVKPAALVLHEGTSKPETVENQLEIEAARQATIKAADDKAKIEKEFNALVKQAEDLIASYYPRKKKTGTLDYTERDSSQAKWKASLNAEKQRNNLERMRLYRDSLVAIVNKRYQDQERASERM